MNELAGPVPGRSIDEQAIFLSGLLAEQGITALELTSDGQTQILPARLTDLPGLLVRVCAGGPGELAARPLELRVELSPGGLRWRTSRAETAALFG